MTTTEQDDLNIKKSRGEQMIILQGIFVCVVIIAAALWSKAGALEPKSEDFKDVPILLGYFFIITLIVERAIEFLLSLSRSSGADFLDNKIGQLNEDVKRALDPDSKNVFLEKLKKAELKRAEYRADSRIAALWTGLGIGIIISLVGVRMLGSIFTEPDINNSSLHHSMFIVIDVIFTGIFIAGGSEAINKIMKLYNSFMNRATENNRQKTIKPDATSAG